MEKNDFLYGTVIKLTREDTLCDIERNFIKMKEAGLDTAVIWPSSFWWEEKKEGYPFNTGKALLEIAERVGIRIIMELAGQHPNMEYIPDFQMKDEYYCVDENGHKRLYYTSFGWLNYFHPEVDALIKAHFKKTAEAYKGYPALVAYDVFNETAFNSYDKYTMERFRIWLKDKYGSIERLNDVWEHSYTDFSQIGYTPWLWLSVMPSADLGAFRRESVGIIVKGWCEAIRETDASRPLIADNIGSMITNDWAYERPQDDFVLKTAVDDIGMSFYPKGVGGTQAIERRWQALDSFYSASKREGFYISELQTHIQAMFNPTTAVRKWELKQWSCEALAAGAKGLIYWMWRPFTKGLQTTGRGLVDYKERSTPRLEFAKELSSTIASLGALRPVRSKVGILFDPLCQDLQILYTKCYSLDQNLYLNSVRGAYGALLDAGVRADVITENELDGYKIVVLSNHIVIGERTAKALTEYVRGGGIVICDGKIGNVDELSMLNPDLPGGGFNACMGLEYIDSDYEGMGFTFDGKAYKGYYGKEIVKITDGEVLAHFDDGAPAIVGKRTGKGYVVTVNTYLWYSYGKTELAKEIAKLLSERCELCEISVSEPLMARVSENDGGVYAFVFNYTDGDVTGKICYEGIETEVSLKAHDVEIIKVKSL